MAVDLSGIIIGVAATSLVGAVSYFSRRYISGDPIRERVSLFSSYASIAAVLKNNGMTMEEVENIRAVLESRKRNPQANVVPENLNVSPYWTQSAMNIRAAGAADVAEAQLSSALAELSSILTEKDRKRLEVAQLAWSVFRDRQIEFVSSEFEGGSIQPLIRSSECENLTLQRISAVKAIIKERKDR